MLAVCTPHVQAVGRIIGRYLSHNNEKRIVRILDPSQVVPYCMGMSNANTSLELMLLNGASFAMVLAAAQGKSECEARKAAPVTAAQSAATVRPAR